MIVVDTNVIGYMVMKSERSAEAEKAFGIDPEWVAPVLWRSEFRNVLALYLRQELVSLPEALRIMEEAETLMQSGERQVSSLQVLEQANTSTCSAYDCEFVALARDLGVKLVTVDRQILRDFPEDAVGLGEFVGDAPG